MTSTTSERRNVLSKIAAVVGAALAIVALNAYAAAPRALPADSEEVNVLLFWGSWCHNCPKVLQSMEQVRKAYAGKKVKFYAVSLDGEKQPEQYLNAKGVGFESITNGTDMLAGYDAPGVPWVVITDKNGKMIANPSRNTALTNVAAMVKMDLSLRGT
jgi:thiol-disulfide isomerase/thioredoxin